MITRSKLVEQLRDYQIRSQYKWPALTFFSPKPHFTSRADVVVAIFWALLFIMLVAGTDEEKGEEIVVTTVHVTFYNIKFAALQFGLQRIYC
ncbi:hypothetical protein FEM48_Zijuj08G0102400 [Ziziphus jujuba var. spinosa]|uniref:Uncharacterized protein n=1 Tax=Ziziphus jujuba var. spinosa TaxID=714518 RepID=A0A978UYI1_ZIZJJ|nr:hypothetical protein FEM48_Zijuj08G0102400 [Ziziphus jujuba var. spinosa]